MTIESGLPENRLLEVELLYDSSWLEIELSFDDFSKLVIIESLFVSSIGVNVNRDGVSNADTVGNLN